jgi:hypothetical protein
MDEQRESDFRQLGNQHRKERESALKSFRGDLLRWSDGYLEIDPKT